MKEVVRFMGLLGLAPEDVEVQRIGSADAGQPLFHLQGYGLACTVEPVTGKVLEGKGDPDCIFSDDEEVDGLPVVREECRELLQKFPLPVRSRMFDAAERGKVKIWFEGTRPPRLLLFAGQVTKRSRGFRTTVCQPNGDRPSLQLVGLVDASFEAAIEAGVSG